MNYLCSGRFMGLPPLLPYQDTNNVLTYKHSKAAKFFNISLKTLQFRDFSKIKYPIASKG